MRFGRKEIRIGIGVFLLAGLCLPLVFSGAAEATTGYPFDTQARDPMAPLIDRNGGILIPKEVYLGGLNLKGIIYSTTMPLAIINEVLSEGDTVSGCTIIKITERTVSLEKGNEGFTLKLEEE